MFLYACLVEFVITVLRTDKSDKNGGLYVVQRVSRDRFSRFFNIYCILNLGGQMYAIIETGGKQYQVEEGDIIEVELLEGKDISFSQVLLLNDGSKIQIGFPYLKNCVVKGEITGELKGPKVIAYKYKRRKNYRKKKGHRQKYSKVKIVEIKAGK